MGNNQTTLSGIHPFRDPNDPTDQQQQTCTPQSPQPLPPPKLIGFNPVVALPQVTVEDDQQPKPYSEFDELFVVKPPTPPPRRVSSEIPRSRRRSLKGLFGGRNLSLRNLRLSRPDLNKLGTLLRWKKKKVVDVYPVPPDAEKPSPPSKPEVFQEEDYFLLRWDRPGYDGGLPIIGYIIQHLELGLPQTDPDVEKDDTQSWYSSEPGQVTSTEVMLNNLIPGTTYIFRIIAENLLGYSQPGDQSTPIVFNPHGELDDWFCPPVFIITLDESHTVLEHERVCLSVEITGQPYPLVRFYDQQEQELKRELDPMKYSVTSCGQRRTLTINSVEVRDSGVIRVVGENEKGVVECSGVLVVEAPPRIRRVQKLDLTENSPEEDQKLVQSDDGVIYQSGELAKFKFIWSASPYPNVCVYHDSELVHGTETGSSSTKPPSQRVQLEITDNIIAVKIPNVQRSDRGEWMVRLDNMLGEDAASVILTVTDKPSRPGKPDVLQLSDNTVILKWSEPYDSGGFPIHAYTVEYFRSEWGVWLKACTVKPPYTKIRDLIPGSKYKFRVKAENLYGVSEPSDESVELLITDLVSTLRSVSGGEASADTTDSGASTLLMKTVVEEEDEDDVETQQGVRVEEEDPSSVMMMMMMMKRPTPPKRKLFDHGGNEKVSSSTMTDDDDDHNHLQVSQVGSVPTPHSSPSSSSPKLLRVSLQPQVVVLLDDDDEEVQTLKPPEIQPRRSPSPMRRSRNSIIMEEDEPNSREKSPEVEQQPPPVAPTRSRTTIKTQISEPILPQPQPSLKEGGEELRRRQIPVVQPVTDQQQQQQNSTKKLYSRAEIIRSAATEDLDYYLSMSSTTPTHEPEPPEHEDEEEDPVLLEVKEKLANDELEDEDDEEEEEEEEELEYEYDFDKLQQEYEEDKKRGMVSRQDSGVSQKSSTGGGGGVSRGESVEEGEQEPSSIHSDAAVNLIRETNALFRRGSFERAQSEVVVRNKSNTFLHDRFTDYIAMKAASKNQKVGSSLRSLNSRYSSTELLQQQQQHHQETPSKDSGRSSMQQQSCNSSSGSGERTTRSFRVRSFDPDCEKQELEHMERSVSRASFRGTYDLVHSCVQGVDSSSRLKGVSAPDLGNPSSSLLSSSSSSPPMTSRYHILRQHQLEHSRSEQFDGVIVPDSGLQARGLAAFMPGGVDSITSGAEEYSYEDGEGSLEIDLSLERDVPRERELFRGNKPRRSVSFGEDSEVEFEGEELEDDYDEDQHHHDEDVGADDNSGGGEEEVEVEERNERLDELLCKLDKFLEEEDEAMIIIEEEIDAGGVELESEGRGNEQEEEEQRACLEEVVDPDQPVTQDEGNEELWSKALDEDAHPSTEEDPQLIQHVESEQLNPEEEVTIHHEVDSELDTTPSELPQVSDDELAGENGGVDVILIHDAGETIITEDQEVEVISTRDDDKCNSVSGEGGGVNEDQPEEVVEEEKEDEVELVHGETEHEIVDVGDEPDKVVQEEEDIKSKDFELEIGQIDVEQAALDKVEQEQSMEQDNPDEQLTLSETDMNELQLSPAQHYAIDDVSGVNENDEDGMVGEETSGMNISNDDQHQTEDRIIAADERAGLETVLDQHPVVQQEQETIEAQGNLELEQILDDDHEEQPELEMPAIMQQDKVEEEESLDKESLEAQEILQEHKLKDFEMEIAEILKSERETERATTEVERNIPEERVTVMMIQPQDDDDQEALDLVHEIIELEFHQQKQPTTTTTTTTTDRSKSPRPHHPAATSTTTPPPIHHLHTTPPQNDLNIIQKNPKKDKTVAKEQRPTKRESSSSTPHRKQQHQQQLQQRQLFPSTDSVGLSPVAEEDRTPTTSPPPPKPTRLYAPDMSAYDRVIHHHSPRRSTSMSRSSSLSSTFTDSTLRSSSTSLHTTTRSTTPQPLLLLLQEHHHDPVVPLSEIQRHMMVNESTLQLINSIAEEEEHQQREAVSHEKERSLLPPEPMSKFMTYVFNGAFYLCLSPMLLFVDNLYLALVCLVLVACVHYWFILD